MTHLRALVTKRKWLPQIMDKGQKHRLRRNVARAKRAGRTYTWPDAAALRPGRGLSDTPMPMPLVPRVIDSDESCERVIGLDTRIRKLERTLHDMWPAHCYHEGHPYGTKEPTNFV